MKKEEKYFIPRGTTASYELDFNGITKIALSDVISVSMIIRYIQKDIDVSDRVIVDIDNNKIILPFSQIDTFSFKEGENIKIQTDIKYTTPIGEKVTRVGDTKI